MYTSFFDDFNDPDLPGWHPGLIYRGIGQLIDSSLTHRVQNGKLELTMAHVHGYNDSANYVGAEFITNKDFSFGIFECKASFAQGLGSWPAFWAFFTDCLNNAGPEIDFAEYFGKYVTPPATNEIGHYIHHWICGGEGGEVETNYKRDYLFWPTTNIYKCIWTPDKVEFYIDEVKKTTFYNNGQDWFPLSKMQVYVSQQILLPAGGYTPLAPQTSYFDWVKVREYFQPPVITCPNLICSSGTATLDVDSKASNITWTLSPSGLFTGATSGSGKIVSINAGSAMGEGKITYSFEMPGGETFEAEETFWVGTPDPGEIDVINVGPYYPGSMILCSDMPNDGKVDWGSTGSIQEYSWSVFDDGSNYWQVIQHPMDPDPVVPMQNVQLSKPYGSVNGYVNVIVKARNTCGWGAYSAPAIQFSASACGGYFLSFTPNPTNGETTLTIETNSAEKTFDETTRWDLEVYSEMQQLKAKQANLRGQSAKIQTNGWKEGVYSVRVKYQNEILTGKLVVKR